MQEIVQLKDGRFAEVNQLSIEDLRSLGSWDAWIMGSPQTINEHYLEGWEQSVSQAKLECEKNLNAINEQRNSWDIERV